MGMFNTIIVDCPNCQEEVEMQSKSGRSLLMGTFNINNVRFSEIEGILGEDFKCRNCGHMVYIEEPKKDYSNWVKSRKEYHKEEF